MSRRVYVAAPFAGKFHARAIASELRHAGLIVTSAWHDIDLTDEQAAQIESSVALRQAECERDLEGVRHADALLLIWSPNCRGALCEATYAYDLGKRVLVVGDRLLVSLMLDRRGVEWFSRLDAAVLALGRGCQ